MSLFFNMLSRFVIAFLPRSKHLLISWLQSQSTVILEPKKINSITISMFWLIVNSDIVNNGVHASFWIVVFLGYMPRSGIAGSYGLLLGRKAMTNLDSILKNRDITLLTKVHIVKVMVFPVVMYGCESWIIKKAKQRRTDAFKLWCWRRLLRVSWRSNQPILKESTLNIHWKDWC